MTSNFEYYRIFYYVAKYGNLTRAASALNTSQPAVTRTIHKLEDDLGCRLFIRSKMGMELTAEGQQFFEYVSAGCAQFFKGESDLKDRLSLEKVTISISATNKKGCKIAKMYYIHIRMVWKGAKEKQAAPARRHLFFLRHSRTDRLRQQTDERVSACP